MSSGASCELDSDPSMRSTIWSRRRWSGCSGRAAGWTSGRSGRTPSSLRGTSWRRSGADGDESAPRAPAVRSRATGAARRRLLVEDEENAAVRAALDRLSHPERDVLVAHEVDGQATARSGRRADRRLQPSPHDSVALGPSCVSSTSSSSPVSHRRHAVARSLLSLSAGDRRRQAELDVGYHLLECEFCAAVSESLLDRRSKVADDEVRIPVRVDADVVAARQRGRELAIRAGFAPTDATVIATAISEIARNIVRFAERGEMMMAIVQDGETRRAVDRRP